MRSETELTRRSFLAGGMKAAVILPVLGLEAISCGRKAVAENSAREVPAKIAMVADNEPGATAQSANDPPQPTSVPESSTRQPELTAPQTDATVDQPEPRPGVPAV